ncbi:hypothetical protein BDF20DRAFT_869382 [Mycotypha africana]|uniref:uncharacterized protein n=1 Tax=Mycotypha africana TaxID=64632 RepID=UPI002300B4C4|nr:uncharacterized protein BDF20DRAFT_869382 [Mycotypha africana]KAI8979417.1 hypothetical protein BDF20DRAFT_869382 [Mycotypha africana]
MTAASHSSKNTNHAVTVESEERNLLVHPVPSSVIIVNESTPLISQEQQLAGGSRHRDDSFKIASCFTLSTDEQTREAQIRSLILLSLSSLLFACVSVIVKWIGTEWSSVDIVVARAAVQLLLGLVGCCVVQVNPFGQKGVRRWLFCRAVASSIALFFFFYSLTKLSLIDATAIFFLGPVFKAMFSCAVMNGSFSFLDAFYSIICFTGLFFVSKPNFLFRNIVTEEEQDYDHFFAVVSALLAAVMSATAYITVSKISQRTHIMVHVVYFGLVSLCIGIPLHLFSVERLFLPKDTREAGLLILVGIFAFIGQYLINLGLKKAPRGPVILLRVSDFLYAFIFDIVLFKNIPGFYTLLGSILVVVMTTAISLHRWHQDEVKAATLRQRKSKERLIQQQKLQKMKQQQDKPLQREQAK